MSKSLRIDQERSAYHKRLFESLTLLGTLRSGWAEPEQYDNVRLDN